MIKLLSDIGIWILNGGWKSIVTILGIILVGYVISIGRKIIDP